MEDTRKQNNWKMEREKNNRVIHTLEYGRQKEDKEVKETDENEIIEDEPKIEGDQKSKEKL